MNPNLFKASEFYHRRYHNFATVLIIPLVCLVGFLVLFSFLGKKEITITTTGEITPTKVIDVVQSTSNNTVEINHLKENKRVTKGDLLIQYSEKLETSQLDSLQSQIDRYEEQETALQTLIDSLKQGTNLFSKEDDFGYSATVDNFINQSLTISQQIDQANSSVAKQEAGVAQANAAINTQIAELNTQISHYQEVQSAITSGQTTLPTGNPYSSMLNNYLSQVAANKTSTQTESGQTSTTTDNQVASANETLKNQYISDIQNTIDNLKTSLSSLKTQAAGNYATGTYDNSASSQIEGLRSQALTQAETTLAQVSSDKENLQSQFNQGTIEKEQTQLKAEKSGILHLNSQYEGQTLLPQETTIAEIYPDLTKTRTVAVTYFVTSSQVSQLKKSQKVRLTLEKLTHQSVTITGKISQIASSATSTKNGNYFKITAIAHITSTNSHKLKYGLQGKVVSVIGKKSFFEYYKDKLLKEYQ